MNYADVKKHRKLVNTLSVAIDSLIEAEADEKVKEAVVEKYKRSLVCKENTLKNFLNKHPEFKIES